MANPDQAPPPGRSTRSTTGAQVGRRADWRFLLSRGERAMTAVVGPRETEADWKWLIDDGWTDSVAIVGDQRMASAIGHTADVVLVRSPDLLDHAAAVASPNAVLVVELPRRSPAGVTNLARKLSKEGFGRTRWYLATPSVARPLRLTPLGQATGLRWLLEPSPFGPPPLPNRLGRSAAGIGARLLRSPAGSLLVDRLVIAERRSPSPSAADRAGAVRPGLDALLPTGCDDAVLVTSGHDDGSRAVLLPIGPGRPLPTEVVKVSARPRFNRTIDDEATVVQTLRATAGEDGSSPLPEIHQHLDFGPLRASRERFAGRWTGSDVCFRQPEYRQSVLRHVLDESTDLAIAGTVRTEPWSQDRFQKLVVEPIDRYLGMTDGSNPKMAGEIRALVDDLAGRSERLAGWPMPLVLRHYDLGPWNVVFGADRRLTIIDWERAAPRRPDQLGPAGADQLYFVKYWLHTALCEGSADEGGRGKGAQDELTAFEFLPGRTGGPRGFATETLSNQFDRMAIDTGFVPVLTAHLWAEKALYTMTRRGGTADPGLAGPYLGAVARYRADLLRHWPVS